MSSEKPCMKKKKKPHIYLQTEILELKHTIIEKLQEAFNNRHDQAEEKACLKTGHLK